MKHVKSAILTVVFTGTIFAYGGIVNKPYQLKFVNVAQAASLSCPRECQASKASADRAKKRVKECGRELNKMLSDGKSSKDAIMNKAGRCADLKVAGTAASGRYGDCMRRCLSNKAKGGSRFEGAAQ